MLPSEKNKKKNIHVLYKIVQEIRIVSKQRGFPIQPLLLPYDGIASDIVGYVFCGRIGMIVINHGFGNPEPEYAHQTFVIPKKYAEEFFNTERTRFPPRRWITQEDKETVPGISGAAFVAFALSACSAFVYESSEILSLRNIIVNLLDGDVAAKKFLSNLQTYGVCNRYFIELEANKIISDLIPKPKFLVSKARTA